MSARADLQAVGGTAERYFQFLGRTVQQRWKQLDCDEREFAEIADQVLQDHPPHQALSLEDVLEYAFDAELLPFQIDLDSKFGQPPLVVFWNQEFYIQVLFWTSGSTAIHQHSFSGAFHVMAGSSLHCEWQFHPVYKPVKRLQFGQMVPVSTELLAAGDTRKIRGGSMFIHATHHLDRPTISIVIRTNRERDYLPQFTFLPPCVAYVGDEDGLNDGIIRRTQLIHMLARAGLQDHLVKILARYVKGADAFSLFHCLLASYPLIHKEDDRARLLELAQRHNPKLTRALRPALLRHERSVRLTDLSMTVSDPEIRFFLCVLSTMPDYASIVRVIDARYPGGHATTKIVGWIRKLCDIGVIRTGRYGTIRAEAADSFCQRVASLLDSTQTHEMPEAILSSLAEAPSRMNPAHWILAALCNQSSLLDIHSE